jgi:salicylate hydroxylase
MDAVVVGAGIGGLAAALALSQRGVEVTVLERSPVFGEVGAGLQLSPNAGHVLRALGVLEAARDAAFAPEAASIRDGRSGAVRMRQPLGTLAEARWGAPYLNLHRADLHGFLLSAAKKAGVVVQGGVRVLSYERHGGAAVIVAELGRTRRADLLVAADGVRSAVRARMLGAEEPRYTGFAAWRAVVPAAALPSPLPPEAVSWIGRDRHLVTYYLRGNTLLNLVAVTRRAAWTEEGWSVPGDPDELRTAFGGWHPSVSSALSAVREAYLWGLFDRPSAPKWTDGPACLLGDAGHPMLPFMAQGAAMAIEDAWVLAAEVARGGPVAAALARYEARRRPRTTAVQAQAGANASLFHGRGLAPLKLAAARALPGLARARMDAVYGVDVTAG